MTPELTNRQLSSRLRKMGYRKADMQMARNANTYTIDDEVVGGLISVTFAKHGQGWSIIAPRLKGFSYTLMLMSQDKWHQLQCNDRIPLHEYVNKDGSVSTQNIFLAIAKGISNYVVYEEAFRTMCEEAHDWAIANE